MPVQPGQYVNIHAHRMAAGSHEWVLTNLMTSEYPPVKSIGAYYSIGLHPWKLSEADMDNVLITIQKAVQDPNVLAVGESGLDKLIEIPLPFQQSVFEAQAAIAEDLGIPLIIHMVKTAEELIRYMKTHKPGTPMIIHGFQGNLQLAEDLLRAGFFLSFGEGLVKSEKTKEAFSRLPLDRLFLETDGSAVDIRQIYGVAAEALSIGEADLVRHMAEKTNTLFQQ